MWEVTEGGYDRGKRLNQAGIRSWPGLEVERAWNVVGCWRCSFGAVTRFLFSEAAMSQESALIDRGLKTPRAAAIAGIIFSVLLATSELLIRSSIPANPLGSATELVNHSKNVARALNLVPFAGIAFLWFIAVVRDRLGNLEDRFFATVFLGSGLLYIAMVFASAALSGGLLLGLTSGTENLIQSGAYAVSRAQIYQMMNIYAIKMAGVFMISTSTISLRTRIFPRWLAFLGYALALLLLLTIGTIAWTPMVFPLWVLLASVCILMQKFRGQPEAEQDSTLAA
jgi:hypothetical protein